MQQMIFIADLIACSTCFGQQCVHHQELESIIQVVAACGIWCFGFEVVGMMWSWGLCFWFVGCCFTGLFAQLACINIQQFLPGKFIKLRSMDAAEGCYRLEQLSAHTIMFWFSKSPKSAGPDKSHHHGVQMCRATARLLSSPIHGIMVG